MASLPIFSFPLRHEMKPLESQRSEAVTAFQLVLLILSLVVMGALVITAVVPISREVHTILQTLDLVACFAFFIDFVIRFKRAESKLYFMKWGWLDLISCIPTMDVFRAARLLQV